MKKFKRILIGKNTDNTRFRKHLLAWARISSSYLMWTTHKATADCWVKRSNEYQNCGLCGGCFPHGAPATYLRFVGKIQPRNRGRGNRSLQIILRMAKYYHYIISLQKLHYAPWVIHKADKLTVFPTPNYED